MSATRTDTATKAAAGAPSKPAAKDAAKSAAKPARAAKATKAAKTPRPAKAAKAAKSPRTSKTAKRTGAAKPATAAPQNQDRLFAVLLGPIVSEKSTMIGEKNEQVAFRVKPDATKVEVKQAVEMLFKVQVERVSILNQRGKSKRFGRMIGQRGGQRKAYVSLKPGQEINFAQEVK